MPLLRAWETFQPNGRLEITLCNTSGPDADASSIVYSLRSSHPSYFALIGAVLPDGVLLPGERRTLLLELRPDSIKWWGSSIASSGSQWKRQTTTSMGTTLAEMSLWGLPSSQSQTSPTNSAPISVRELQGSPRQEMQSIGKGNSNSNNNTNNNSNSNSVPAAHSGSGGHNNNNEEDKKNGVTDVDKPIPVQQTKTFKELGPPMRRQHQHHHQGEEDKDGVVRSVVNGEHNTSHSTKCVTPTNRSIHLTSDSSLTENTVIEGITHTVSTPRDDSTPNMTKHGGRLPVRRHHDNNNNNGKSTSGEMNGVKESNGRYKNNVYESLDTPMSIQDSNKGLPTWRNTDPSSSVVERNAGSISDTESAARSTTPVKPPRTPSDVSQGEPYFFVYYERLGDESSCLNAANKWLKSERMKYLAWQEKLRQTMQQQGLDECNCLPPVLGEPVRWLSNGKGINAQSTYHRLSRKPYSRSSAKMFKSSRQGGGCVLLPCRLRSSTALSALAAALSSPLSAMANNMSPDNVIEVLSTGSDRTNRLNNHNNNNSGGGGGGAGRAGQGLALFDLSENIHKGHNNNNHNNNHHHHYSNRHHLYDNSTNSTGGNSVGTRRPAATVDEPSLYNNRSSDQLSTSQLSNEYSLLAFSRNDPVLDASRKLLSGSEQPVQPLPQFPSTVTPRTYHNRTETEGTVQMLDQTVCGESSTDCANNSQYESREEMSGKKSNDLIGQTETSPKTQENLKNKLLGGLMGSFLGFQQENNFSPTSITPREIDAMLPKKRASLQMDTNKINLNGRRGSVPVLSRRASTHVGRRTARVSELRITQFCEAVRGFVCRYAPLVQTAVDGTITTVSASAQLIGGLLEDSFDILAALGVPLLLLLSLFLLWMVFGGIGDDDDITTSTMGFFA